MGFHSFGEGSPSKDFGSRGPEYSILPPQLVMPASCPALGMMLGRRQVFVCQGVSDTGFNTVRKGVFGPICPGWHSICGVATQLDLVTCRHSPKHVSYSGTVYEPSLHFPPLLPSAAPASLQPASAFIGTAGLMYNPATNICFGQ